MKLDAALALRPREVISFAGAGGKTSAMFRLARELAGQGHAVVATTTTAIFAPEPGQADAV
ncbi:MAG: putative selenium-dependent hydroxylase accessory protein YqeC, partial [Actinobacteria bacterium]|nr:putative selenium-dependent hydroxylase accessory protein YqeC [Actinomycetota bacterium]